MKTKKLIKRTAAFCLTLAGFCAAQSAFAEVTVPEWQNSFTTAPTTAFYLYNTAKGKFATNSLTLLDDESKATTWTYSSKKGSTNGQYLNRNNDGLLEFNNSGTTEFSLDYSNSNGKWGIHWVSWWNDYYIQANPDIAFAEKNKDKIYEWYFISEVQYKNHRAIVVDINTLITEANGYVDDKDADETVKQQLQDAISNAETNLPSLDMNSSDATTAIDAAKAQLKKAIGDYKALDRQKYLDALTLTINTVKSKNYPNFDFLTKLIKEAEDALTNDNTSAYVLDEYKAKLEAADKTASSIVEDNAFTTYQNNIATIGENIEKASDYTSYATELTGVKSQAENDFLAITSVASLTDINNTLKNANDAFGDKLNLCNAAWAVATQANAVGYEEGFVTVKALTSKDITAANIKTTINNIRNSAKNGVRSYIANYIGLNPIDMTIFVNNNSFELGDTDGWTLESAINRGDTGVKVNEDMAEPSVDCDGRYMYNTWKDDGKTGYGITQEIADLPNGKYRLEALLTSSPENKLYLANGKGLLNKPTIVKESEVTSETGHTQFVTASCEFNVTNGKATIGASADGKWFRADNFRLTLLPATMDEDGNEKPSDYTSGDVMPVVKVTRDIKANQWTTLCLPMECAKPESLTLYEVTGETEDNGRISVTVAASSDEKIKAGKPYIVKNADAVISEFISNGVSLVEAPKTAGEFIPFTGLFTTTELNAGDIYVSTSTDNANGDAPVYKSLSAEATNKSMKGFRAYFQVPAGENNSVRFITDGDITGIMQAIEDQQAATGIYNLGGRKASTLQKGIYVIDGKKVIIK